MSIEIRGLIAAIAAALFVLGAAFGVAAIVRATQPTPVSPPVTQVSRTTPPPVPGTQASLVTLGRGFYAQSCASCHGAQGEGNIGPSLQNTDQSNAQITQKVKYGVAGAMPAFGSQYSDHDIQAITAYVHTLK